MTEWALQNKRTFVDNEVKLRWNADMFMLEWTQDNSTSSLSEAETSETVWLKRLCQGYRRAGPEINH